MPLICGKKDREYIVPINTVNNDPVGLGKRPPTQPVRLVTPKEPAGFQGKTRSEVNVFKTGQFAAESDLVGQFNKVSGAGAATDAASRRGLQDRLKFGLERFGLQREGNALDRRDNIEGAISNALNRGIFRSGIRIRNVERAKERPALAGKNINLSEKELRAGIKNALESLRAGANEARAASDLRQSQALEQLRRDNQIAMAEFIGTDKVFEDAPVFQPYVESRF